MNERRRHFRIDVEIPVELVGSNLGRLQVKTRNLSDGGVFLEITEGPLPEVGQVVTVRILNKLGDGTEPPTNRMEVRRVANDGVGLMFIEPAAAD